MANPFHHVQGVKLNLSAYLRGYLHHSDNRKFFTFLKSTWTAIPVILLWGQNHNTNQKLKSLWLQNDLKSHPPTPSPQDTVRAEFPYPRVGVAWSVVLKRPQRLICQWDEGVTKSGFWFHLSFLISKMGLRAPTSEGPWRDQIKACLLNSWISV